jgi:hypothetical protein
MMGMIARDAQGIERRASAVFAGAGGNRPGDFGGGEKIEQFACAGEGADDVGLFGVGFCVEVEQFLAFSAGDGAAGFAEDGIDHQAAAHAHAAMDAPDIDFEIDGAQGFAPGEDVGINAVDKRAVEIEKKCALAAFAVDVGGLFDHGSPHTSRAGPSA